MSTRPALTDPDAVIVGAGIGGGALAATLSRGGLDVVLLERDRRPVDRVRGEWMVPWGVAELIRLGLYERLMQAGAHHNTTYIPYGDSIDPEAAERAARDFTVMVEGVPGPINLGHPAMCAALAAAAAQAGARLLRGVRRIELTPGRRPSIAIEHDGSRQLFRPRLVVGADGRGSLIARQAGITLERDEAMHLLGGLLVEGADAWPTHVHSIGASGSGASTCFPQGGGRLRLYLSAPLGNRREVAGADGTGDFLRHFDFDRLPAGRSVAAASPAGPLQFYPNADHWADRPVAPGVVLIGDAAGHNDPSIGQGLSIALRDARLVGELLLSQPDWSEALFAPYVEERRERLRRLRIVGRMFARVYVTPGEDAAARRQRVGSRMAADPAFAPMFGSCFVGPERLPAEAFSEQAQSRILQA